MSNENKNRGLYDHIYKSSSIINIASYFKDYKTLIENTFFDKHYETKNKEYIYEAINDDIDDEKFKMLEKYCDIDNLTVDGELGKMTKTTFEWCKDPEDPSVLNDIELQTVNYSKQRNLLKNYQVHLKYRSEKPVIYEPVLNNSNNETLIPEDDILIFIRIYVPFTSRQKQSTGALGKLSIDCVIVMYGSQTLDELRDQISCISDHSISSETSRTPFKYKSQNAKNVYKSAFFFIEDTFYLDLRDPNNKDNSKVIREWAEIKKYGSYKTAKMEETRIDSLSLKFGFPWVYQHQGDCEHLISFSNARLVNPTDELNIQCYPRIVRIKPRPNRYCMTCGIYSVNWVITSNNRLPHNPCFFCDSCFKSYNYIGGKKIGSFKAYPYPFNSDLLESNLNLHTKVINDSTDSSICESQLPIQNIEESVESETSEAEMC